MGQSIENTFRIPSPTDESILLFFEKIRSEYDISSNFSVVVSAIGLGEYPSYDKFSAQRTGDWKSSKIISAIDLITPNQVGLHFRRKCTIFSNAEDFNKYESDIYADLGTSSVENQNLIISILKHVEDFSRSCAALLPRTTTEKTLSRTFSSQIQSLTELQVGMLKENERYRLQNEVNLDKRRAQIEKELELERKKVATELEALRQSNLSESARLDQLQKDLDDRTHTHARRAMRERITSDLRDRLGRPPISKTIQSHRQIITGICVLLFLVFVITSAISVVELSQILAKSPMPLYPFYVSSARLAASIAALAGVGFYLLGFLRKVHDADLRQERDLERYLYDVDRSSWVIETVLEAQSKEAAGSDADIPTDWIKGVTHGLFARSESRDDDPSPLDGIGSLLNFAAEAKFGPAGPEIRLQRGDIKRLKRQVDKDEGPT